MLGDRPPLCLGERWNVEAGHYCRYDRDGVRGHVGIRSNEVAQVQVESDRVQL
jgi:hypothetical protein